MKTNLLKFIFLATAFMSCKKSFLDVPMTREVVADDYIVNLSSATEFLNGLYLTAANTYSWELIMYADLAADNLKDLNSTLTAHYNWSMNANASQNPPFQNMNVLWLNGYKAIRSCNFLLSRIDRFSSEDPVQANSIKGQALALRALIHFNIVNVFAQPFSYSAEASHPGIPYDTVYSESKSLRRHTVNEVYNSIIADLQNAIQLLPVSITNQATFTPDGVNALLTRVLLFKGDYVNANILSNKIVAKYPLMSAATYPRSLYTNNDTETLFWFPPAEPSVSFPFFQGGYFDIPGYFGATSDLVNIVAEHPNDLRNSWFVKDASTGSWQIKKFPVGAVDGMSYPPIAYYQTVIRVSEVYLTAAETYAQLGNEDSARFYLDAIRIRADSSVTSSIATGTSLIDSIHKERRKELCFENLRLFDLLRTKSQVARIDVNPPAPSLLPFPSNKAIAPIPSNDVLIYGLTQNEGY